MKNKSIYLIILIFVLISGTITISLSYIGTKINKEGDFKTQVRTGSLDIELSDNRLENVTLIPIYDRNYYKSGYKKELTLTSFNSTLNSCTNIYLKINNYDEILKNPSFKFKITGDDVSSTGTFEDIDENGYLLLAKDIYMKSNSLKELELYIWLSYLEDVDQSNLLNTNIDANIYIKSFDSETSCK